MQAACVICHIRALESTAPGIPTIGVPMRNIIDKQLSLERLPERAPAPVGGGLKALMPPPPQVLGNQGLAGYQLADDPSHHHHRGDPYY